jgi:two-component system, chemotaxis family, sensor kinase CheA
MTTRMELIQQTFIAESRELLRAMESALLQLEKAPHDAELINAVFRAAHTIKGSSGTINFDAIVEFTHAMESVLQLIRSGELRIDNELVALLLKCGDHVSALLDCLVAGDKDAAFARIDEAGRRLLASLNTYLGSSEAVATAPVRSRAADEPAAGDNVASNAWHISLRFGPDVLRHGLDPLSFIRYLSGLGEIAAVTTLFDTMPEASLMDPETCYLGMELDFKGPVDKETIENVFDYLREDCVIRILPPHSRIADYISLIVDMPEDEASLGDLLVNSGALTRRELEEGLRLQRQFDERSGGKRPEHLRKLGEILVHQGVVQNELVDAALDKQDLIKKSKTPEANFIRVRSDNLDELINLVGELVIASAASGVIAQRAAESDMIEAASTLARLVEQVRDGALRLRMVPIGETLSRFDRLVHDLSQELGKDVELILTGAETELDKSMVERISDPLVHLVRNALDHGIEAPDVRERCGKPSRGRLQLNAYHESGSIVIEVADDGRGLDRKKILARAIERNLVAPGHNLSDQEILRLIMEPGFSTAEQVTSVSGRGIGLDVVRRNVEPLRGSVAIESKEGEGTTISIRLPLTLAIIEGFLVAVGRAAYVVPLEVVVECLELSEQDGTRIRETGYLNLRGEVLPLLRLRDVFEVPGGSGRRENVVVVNYGGQRAGFVVDALLGEFQAVIKPLGKLFERLAGISGSTILGSGEVALILDVPTLVQRAINSEVASLRRRGERTSAAVSQRRDGYAGKLEVDSVSTGPRAP